MQKVILRSVGTFGARLQFNLHPKYTPLTCYVYICGKQIPMNSDALKGQSALITGADSGIGKGVAVAMAAAGANVIINHVDAYKVAEQTVDEITAAGGTAYATHADVSNEAEVQAMFAEMYQQYGTIDILVNNAGLQRDSRFVDMTLAQWNTVISINLTRPVSMLARSGEGIYQKGSGSRAE